LCFCLSRTRVADDVGEGRQDRSARRWRHRPRSRADCPARS
jgi:hypothetical protein